MGDLTEVMGHVFPGKSFGVHKWDHHGCKVKMSVETTALVKKYYASDFKMREAVCPIDRLEVKHQELASKISGKKDTKMDQQLDNSSLMAASAKLDQLQRELTSLRA